MPYNWFFRVTVQGASTEFSYDMDDNTASHLQIDGAGVIGHEE